MHRSMTRLIRVVTPLAVVAAFAPVASVEAAAIPISGGYFQNFNTLPTSGGSWEQDSTLPGWSAYLVTSGAPSGGAVTDAAAINASAGGSATAGLYSWGPVSNSERALGSVASDTAPGAQTSGNARASIYYVLRLVNDTGSDITSVNVGYTGEQWRAAASQTGTHELTFQYFVGSTPDFGKAPGYDGWSSDVAGLTFSASYPNSGGTGIAGTTAPVISTALSADLPVSLPAGGELYLRWRDVNDPGNDHGVAVDDLSVSYTLAPEPSAAALLLVAVSSAVCRRRRLSF